MVKVQNRSLFVLLLVAACLAPTTWASARPHRIAQSPIDNPDTVDNPDAEGDLPAEGDTTTPPELSPTFDASPAELPEDSNLTIEGSSSMDTITRSLLRNFQQDYPGTSVTLVERPTETALQNLQAGSTDLAAIGRTLSDEQQAQGLTAVPVSREKIAVIVGANNPFDGQIEAEDFVRIFRGEVTNWIELGGPDLPIRFIDRPETSDTRASLGDYEIFEGDLSNGDNVVRVENDSTAEVVEALGDNGIGYAIASQVLDQENVRVVAMHDTLPDNPQYPYSQPRTYVYLSTQETPAEVEAFLALATTAEGQAAVEEAKAAEAADVAVADLPDRVSAMRPNGQGFVTGDRTGNLNFWNANGTTAGEPQSAHTGPVTALAFSNDGQRLISGGADGTIRLWDSVGNPIGEPINAGHGPVTSLTVQSDGSFISGSDEGVLQQWNSTGNPVGAPITGHEDTVRDIALSPDGNALITASEDGTIRRWNTADGSALGDPLTGHQGGVQALTVQPDGRIFSGGADGTVRQWDQNGTQVSEPLQISGPVNAIARNPDGTSVAVGDDTGALQYLSGEGVPVGSPLTDVGAPVDDLVFTPDGQRLVVSAGETPQLRDDTGQIVPIPQADSPDETDSAQATAGLPPEMLELWEQLEGLPPQVLWIIPVAVLALLLLGLLRSFRQDEEELDNDEVVGLLPGEQAETTNSLTADDFTTDDFTADDFGQAPANSVAQASTGGPVAGFTADAEIDTSLTKAKQTLTEGVSLGNAGRYQAALERFNKAIELADIERLKAAATGASLAGAGLVIARGLARRGTALANLDRPDEALKSLNRALEMDGNDVAAWIGKGNVLAQMGQLDEALFCFDKAIELNPNLAAAWQGKGNTLKKMGRDAEARNCFSKAESLGGVNEDIPIELGTPAISSPDSVSHWVGDSVASNPGQQAMRPASRPAIEPGPLPEASTSNQPMFNPITPGTLPASPRPHSMPPAAQPPRDTPIGPIGITPPPSPVLSNELDELPAELLTAINNLPDDSNASGLTGQAASMPTIEPSAPLPETADTAVPPDILQSVTSLPAEPESAAPNAPLSAPVEVPREVSAILSGNSDIPAEEETLGAAAVKDPMATFLGNDASVAMRPPAHQPPAAASVEEISRFAPTVPPRSSAPSTEPHTPTAGPTPTSLQSGAAIAPDQPTDDDALSGVPPEVLEALRGIPADSPDSFDLPPTSRPTPPPPPTNPRIRDET
ncbi:MAG: substrate-binding domain-containing protein [Leptolyngbyaceae cyanobacterium]